jgi:hypothetical protein
LLPPGAGVYSPQPWRQVRPQTFHNPQAETPACDLQEFHMRRKQVRWLTGLATTALMGALYQTGCMSFAADQVQRSVDFCFLFDCQNGAFGGLINFCPNNENSDLLVNSQNANTFIDCPVQDGY